MKDPELDRKQLLACRTEEEWQWWIEKLLLEGELRPDHDCLFCLTYEKNCFACMNDILVNCISYYHNFSTRYFAGWDRLRRAGIV